MAVPGWVVVLFVVIHLVKVPAILYLGGSTEDSEDEAADRNGGESAHGRERIGTENREPTLCGACGAENDPSFRFCRDCAAPVEGPWSE